MLKYELGYRRIIKYPPERNTIQLICDDEFVFQCEMMTIDWAMGNVHVLQWTLCLHVLPACMFLPPDAFVQPRILFVDYLQRIKHRIKN